MTTRILADDGALDTRALEQLLEDLAIVLMDVEDLASIHVTLYGCGGSGRFNSLSVGAWRGDYLLDPHERADLGRHLEAAFVRCAPEARFERDPTRDALLVTEVFLHENRQITGHRRIAANVRTRNAVAGLAARA